jgi:hypothetical protein
MSESRDLPVTAAGQDGEGLVTPEMVERAGVAYDDARSGSHGDQLRAVLAAVAPDIAEAVRRECAWAVQRMIQERSWQTLAAGYPSVVKTTDLDELILAWVGSAYVPTLAADPTPASTPGRVPDE